MVGPLSLFGVSEMGNVPLLVEGVDLDGRPVFERLVQALEVEPRHPSDIASSSCDFLRQTRSAINSASSRLCAAHVRIVDLQSIAPRRLLALPPERDAQREEITPCSSQLGVATP